MKKDKVISLRISTEKLEELKQRGISPQKVFDEALENILFRDLTIPEVKVLVKKFGVDILNSSLKMSGETVYKNGKELIF